MELFMNEIIKKSYSILYMMKKHVNYIRDRKNYNKYFEMSDEDFSSALNKISCNIELTLPEGENTVIFVGELLSPRFYKISKALSLKGWNIILLKMKNVAESVSTKEYNNIFSEVIVLDDVLELAKYLSLCKNKNCLVHYFGTHCKNAGILVKHKAIFPKIIFEPYDTRNGMYSLNSEKEKWDQSTEKYVLENADGIIGRDFATEFLKDVQHFNLTSNVLIFLDYMDSINSNYKKNEGELNLCYVGGVTPDGENSPLACHIEFAKLCEQNKCHYHVYPSRWNNVIYKELIDFDEKSAYFHFHKPVPIERLIDVMSSYDYLVFPFHRKYLESKTDDEYTREKFIYGCTNKYFDGLAAGLPIIGIACEKMLDYLGQHGAVIKWGIEDMDFEYLINNRNRLRKETIEKSDFWNIDNHIMELIEFYNRVKDS